MRPTKLPLVTATRIVPMDPAHPERCQDRLEIIERSEGTLIILADGAGGMSSGSKAAELAITRMKEAIKPGGSLLDQRAWVRAIVALDEELKTSGHGGETTVVVVATFGDRIIGASAGDSGAWMLRGKRGAIVELTSAQRRQRAGCGVVKASAFEAAWDGGMLLVGSDGLFKYVAQPVILRACTTPDVNAAADELVRGARLKSGALQDDLSVAVCRVA